MRRLLKAIMVASWITVGGLSWAARDAVGSPGDTRTSSPSSSGRRRTNLKWRALQITALLLLLGIGGFLVAASGIIPIKASSGHWPITAWLLNFSMERSVSTHTIGMKAPPLDDPALVLRGAGHYETGCRPCHGSPELPHPRIAQAMTPHPPYLPPAIPNWESEELFYIVKHGVKFTGMPAWPTQQRDDEVWAMVAFLREFPELDVEQYRQLARGELAEQNGEAPLHDLLGADAVPRPVRETCARCHGVQGNGRGVGAFPKLAGQRRVYLEASLTAYARGKRHSGIMEPIAAGLNPEQIRELAQYFSELAPEPAETAADLDREAIARGEEIARRGVPDQLVPACSQCHGPSEHRRNPLYPVLSGQYPEYLITQLEVFKKQQRGGTPYAHIMHQVAAVLTEQQIRDLAAYYASLRPESGEE